METLRDRNLAQGTRTGPHEDRSGDRLRKKGKFEAVETKQLLQYICTTIRVLGSSGEVSLRPREHHAERAPCPLAELAALFFLGPSAEGSYETTLMRRGRGRSDVACYIPGPPLGARLDPRRESAPPSTPGQLPNWTDQS